MKSLNDLIWNEDADLEEGKEDDVTISKMGQICLINSCKIPPFMPPLYATSNVCMRGL